MLRVILAGAGLFIVFASAIWALLPLTAQSGLHLGAGGYGLLLGASGSVPRPGPPCYPGCAPACRRTRSWRPDRRERAGLSVTLTIAAAGLALGPLAGRV